MDIRVDCYAGYRGEETPKRLIMGAHPINAVAIQDRWLAPDHRYFKVIGDDGGLYIIRHDPHQDCWQLTCYNVNPMDPSPSRCIGGYFSSQHRPDSAGIPT